MAQTPQPQDIERMARHAANTRAAAKSAGRSLRTMARELAQLEEICSKYGIELVVEPRETE